MIGTSLSRWTLPHFAVALVFLLSAQGVIAAGWAYPAAPVGAPGTLAVVHLLTIGWLTVLILGALLQFVPMVTARPASNGMVALLPLIGICTGLAGMVAGFLSLDSTLPAFLVVGLPAGGLLVLVATTMAAAPLAAALWHVRPMPLPIRFVLAGLGFLLATAGLGVVLGAIFACPTVFPWGRVFAGGLRVHITGGLLGWFTLTALGVSYRLLAMFMLAPDDRGRLGDVAFLLTAGGLALAWFAGLGRMLDLPLLDWLMQAGEAAAGLGVAVFLADMLRLYRARRRPALELHGIAAAVSFGALGVAILLLASLRVTGRLEDLAGPVLYLLLFGWLSGLGLGQLYKLIPFLTWLHRFGPLLGKAPVPRIEDMVNERRAAPWFALYFVAIAAGTVFGLLGWPSFWRVAIAAHLLATVGIALELWRAWNWQPHNAAASRAPAPTWPSNRHRQQEGALP